MSDIESPQGPRNALSVAYLNEPDLEKKLPLVPSVQKYLAHAPRYAGKRLSVEYADSGVSSLVAFISYDGKRQEALKIPVKPEDDIGTAAAFRAWGKQNVRVPAVYDEGELDGRPYTLMEYIDVKAVDETRTREELLASEWFVVMGQTLRRLHEVKGSGYGKLDAEGNGILGSLEEWLNEPESKERDAYVRTHGLIDPAILDAAREKLSAYADGAQTVLCHNDFSISNILDTNPPTVFDPAPELNAPLVDLGKTIMNSAPFNDAVIEQIIRGYESGDTAAGIAPMTVDRSVLFAAFIVTAVRNKIVKKHRDGPGKPASVERVKGLQDYIEEHKALLKR